MITLKTSVNIAPNAFSCCAKFDATRILAGGQYTPVVGGDPAVYMYSWNGTVFTPVTSVTIPGGETTGEILKVYGNYVFRNGRNWSTASGCGVGQVEWDGSAFINIGMLYYYPGFYFTGEWRGDCYGYDIDSNMNGIIHVCGRTANFTPFPPSSYLYTLDALTPGPTGSGILKQTQVVSSTDAGTVVCGFGFVYLCGATTTRKYVYILSPASYIFQGSYPSVGLRCWHTNMLGAWLLGSSGSVLSAYNMNVSLVSSINTGATIYGVSSSGGYIFVSQVGATKVYTYDGATYTLVDSAALGIEKAFII